MKTEYRYNLLKFSIIYAVLGANEFVDMPDHERLGYLSTIEYARRMLDHKTNRFITLRFDEKKTYRQIGEVLGYPNPERVRQKVQQARNKLSSIVIKRLYGSR